MFVRNIDYPAFLPQEIQAIEQRILRGDRFTREEISRMERHSPLIEGEALITCHRGSYFMKRYLGIDLNTEL